MINNCYLSDIKRPHKSPVGQSPHRHQAAVQRHAKPQSGGHQAPACGASTQYILCPCNSQITDVWTHRAQSRAGAAQGWVAA